MSDYSCTMEVKDKQLIITTSVEIDGKAGEIEIKLEEEGLSDKLRDLAQKIDHPEIIKLRYAECKECGGVVDLHRYKFSEDEDPIEAEICRDCKLGRTSKMKFKL